MNVKVNVKNILMAMALGGSLFLTGCGAKNEAVGTINVYSNNINMEHNYALKETSSYGYVLDNTIQDGDYYTIKEALLVNENKNEIIAKIGLDTYVRVLGEDGDYYLVNYNGIIGYISKECIMPKEYVLYNDNSIEAKKLYSIKHMIRANGDVNINDDMNVDSNILGILKNNHSIEIISHENGWYRIKYGDTEGFVQDNNVSEEFIVDGNILKIVYIIEDTDLLFEDRDEVQRSLEFYESAEVLDDLGDYYLVNVDNVVGRVKKNACFEIDRKIVVVVDLSSQTLKLYDDKDVLLYTRVVTGKEDTPSEKGLYAIYKKVTDTYIVDNGYEHHVNYWIPFHDDEGFNDAAWRDDFNRDVYHYDGSCGTIDMSLEDAETLYNNVEVGSIVLVHR